MKNEKIRGLVLHFSLKKNKKNKKINQGILKNDYQYKSLYINLTTHFIQKKKKPIYVYDEVNFGDLLK